METYTPEELVRLCQRAPAGDTRAFEALVAHFKGRVFATAYRIMGDRQEAEDQAQEVFLKLYRGVGRLDDPATVTGWVYRVTTNTCLDALDRQRRRPAQRPLAPSAEAPSDYPDRTNPTPEEAALHQELRRCLEATFAQLEGPERVALVLRELEGRSYQEIAEIVEVGLSAVKMRIHRARLSFQRLLDRICPDAWRRPMPETSAPPAA